MQISSEIVICVRSGSCVCELVRWENVREEHQPDSISLYVLLDLPSVLCRGDD